MYRNCVEIEVSGRRGLHLSDPSQGIEKAIAIMRREDPRTVKAYMENLVLFKFLEPQTVNLFKLNMVKCLEALERAVRSQGQKKLM